MGPSFMLKHTISHFTTHLYCYVLCSHCVHFMLMKNFYRPTLLDCKLGIHLKRILTQSSHIISSGSGKNVKIASPLSYFPPPVNLSLSSPTSLTTSCPYFVAPKNPPFASHLPTLLFFFLSRPSPLIIPDKNHWVNKNIFVYQKKKLLYHYKNTMKKLEITRNKKTTLVLFFPLSLLLMLSSQYLYATKSKNKKEPKFNYTPTVATTINAIHLKHPPFLMLAPIWEKMDN